MMRITGVEYSNKWKCAKQTAISKVSNHCKSYILCARHVGNDDLNYVCHGWHDAHQRSRNFEKVKMLKTNCNFEKFEITVFLIYTVCAMSEMMIYPLFAMVSMMRIRGVEISKKSKCAKQTAISKVSNHCKSYILCARHVGNVDLNYVCHS